MSGAGFAMDAINRTRGNRSLLKKKGGFEVQKANTFREKPSSDFAKYTFKSATPAYLSKLRKQLKREKSYHTLKMIIAFSLSIGITFYFFSLLN